jgi:uncharacterized membrane protein YfcA
LIDQKRLFYITLPALITAPLASFFVGNIQNAHLKQAFGIFLIILGVGQAIALIVQIKSRRQRERLPQKLQEIQRHH